MKRIISFTLFLLICFTIVFSASAQTIKYSVDEKDKGLLAFKVLHPELTYEIDTYDYTNTQQLTGDLLTGQFDCDVYAIDTYSFNTRQLMKKGFCVDLGSSELIRDLISKMHPRIAELAMVDGKIYGMPSSLMFFYQCIDKKAWFEAGLTEVDVPASFPQFLDFLERWCHDDTLGTQSDVCVKGNWYWELYNESSYVAWLTELLIDSYIMTLQYEEKPLRFNDAELLALLDRVKSIGKQLYEKETGMNFSETGEVQHLFSKVSGFQWPQETAYVLFLPINEEQPKLMKATLYMRVVSAYAENQDLRIELLENVAKAIPEHNSAFLYRDAQPVDNPNYERNKAATSANITEIEAQLKRDDLDINTRATLEYDLSKFQKWLLSYEEDAYRYLFSPEQLKNYHELVDGLYFPMPNVFSTGADHYMLIQMEAQFASGVLTAEKFLNELDQVAYMLEMEIGD